MKPQAPHARLVPIREKSTGQIKEVWPVDAREHVNHPSGEWEYAPLAVEQADGDAAPVATPDHTESFLDARLKTREALEQKAYAEIQEIAKKAGVPANQKKGDLIDALLPHIVGGTLSIDEVTMLPKPVATGLRFETV